jgi:hypothetical protein
MERMDGIEIEANVTAGRSANKGDGAIEGLARTGVAAILDDKLAAQRSWNGRLGARDYRVERIHSDAPRTSLA